MSKALDREVRDANRRVFDSKNFDEYEANPSIFEASRQEEIGATIGRFAGRRMLDLGCGTGNLLWLGREHFRACFGVDLSVNLLGELHRRADGLRLAGGEGAHIPFADNSFDLVTLYGVMHHIIRHEPVLREIRRVLRPGGTVYMDHDPNYYFGRFYHLYYRMRYLNRPGFGTDDAEQSEWHHTRTGGLHPDRLGALLSRCGYVDVEVRYRITTNPMLPLPFRIVRGLMRTVTRFWRAKSLYTHFWITARKP